MNPNILLISETGGILIAFLICFIAIPGIVIGICVPISVHRHKYMSFVELYSEAYWKVKEINSRYFFASIPNFDMSHTYDNNDFYPVVSCQDYLTYQLVRLDKKVVKALNDAEDNRIKYSKYWKEICSCQYGVFKNDTTGYNIDTLERYEKQIVEDIIKSPQRSFTITVTLKRVDMGGNYQDEKYKTFNERTIDNILSRIHEKRGSRFLDEEIWQSLVRVERAKVSNKLRFAVFARDHERCVKCGSRRNLEVDHIYPISKGGKTEMSNLQTLCHRCNVKKGNSIE